MLSRRRLRRAVAVVGAVAVGVALLAVGLNWLVVREAGDTVNGEVGAITGKTPCPKADGSSRRVTSFAHPPPRCIKSGHTYTAEVRVAGGGVVTIALDAKAAPVTVNNFVVLAWYHFYDGVGLERGLGSAAVVETAAREPGYTIADERPARDYPVGAVAMLSTGPGTTGGQFFVVTAERPNLAPIYVRFGQVTSGLEALATATSIVSVTMRES